MDTLLTFVVFFLLGFIITSVPGFIQYWTWKRDFEKEREAYNRSIKLYVENTKKLAERMTRELAEAQVDDETMLQAAIKAQLEDFEHDAYLQMIHSLHNYMTGKGDNDGKIQVVTDE